MKTINFAQDKQTQIPEKTDQQRDLNFVYKLKDIQPYGQTFINKNHYIDKNSEEKLKLKKVDFPFYIHDTLLSHEDSKDGKVKHMSLDSIKWTLYYMNKYYPQAKLILHYTPGLYEIYKDNPRILFENVEEYPESVNAKNLCLDTAHVWLSGDKNVDHIYDLAKRAKLIHFNGLKGETKQHTRPGSKQDVIFQDGNKKYVSKILDLPIDKISEW